MIPVIDLQSTPCERDPKIVTRIVDHLIKHGYTPLILEAKRSFIQVFRGSDIDVPSESRSGLDDQFVYYQYQISRTAREREEYGFPIAGELFFSRDGQGMLWIALKSQHAEEYAMSNEPSPTSRLELGYVGNNLNESEIYSFTAQVSEALKEQGIEPVWTSTQPVSLQFANLSRSQEIKFVTADTLSESELNLSERLANPSIRNIAIVVRRSGGGMLASDLLKKGGTSPDEVQSAVESLTACGLLSKEYVVICNKTLNQVNRASSKDKLERMTEIGVLCSCGNPISEERIEEILVPSLLLQKLLDQSYWMTARLVCALKNFSIPEDRILLNLHEGAEEIDAFVDLDGNLFMFELKDSEFSMGHAYPFSGRIGLYKPNSAFIVSTKGVAPEVKEYFRRVKPGSKIIFIEKLEDLETVLQSVIARAQIKKVKALMATFEPMTTIQVSMGRVISALGIGGSYYDDYMSEVRDLLSAGMKIEAIKVYRQYIGVGLKEAKDAVEAIEREL